MQDGSTSQPVTRYRLFDSYGLPWTSSLSVYWLYILTVLTGVVFAFLLGIYLGLWLKSKGRGTSVLFMYLAVTTLALASFAAPDHFKLINDLLLWVILCLWFIAAYVLQRKVTGYYSDRELTPFQINPILTELFSVWYITSRLRGDFPLDNTGQTAPGVLKLSV